jgi:hypothetical protein
VHRSGLERKTRACETRVKTNLPANKENCKIANE